MYQTFGICPFLSDFSGDIFILKDGVMTEMVLCPKLFSGKKEEHSDPTLTLSEALPIHLHDI